LKKARLEKHGLTGRYEIFFGLVGGKIIGIAIYNVFLNDNAGPAKQRRTGGDETISL